MLFVIRTFFGWFPALLAVDDLTILRKCGLDAVMVSRVRAPPSSHASLHLFISSFFFQIFFFPFIFFLSFILLFQYVKLERYALRLVTIVSLLCTCVLVPVNLQGTENLARELKDPENFVYAFQPLERGHGTCF
jgi:hypothetical protein